jgi:hypothetical protein
LNGLNSAGVPFPLAFGGAADMASTASTGASMVTTPGDWSVTNTPAAATAATITKAAAAAGIRHIATGISVTLAAGATAQAAAIIVALRDGLTGAGAILWSKQVILPVNGVWDFNLSGLDIVGSAATAMTLEFTSAPAAGVFASVSLTGHEAA